MTRPILKDTNKGEIITARKLTSITRAINENTKAIPGPKEILQAAEELQPPTSGSGAAVGNEVFNTTSSTEGSVVSTDSNGDTTTVNRFTQIVMTEATSGRTLTLNITYP